MSGIIAVLVACIIIVSVTVPLVLTRPVCPERNITGFCVGLDCTPADPSGITLTATTSDEPVELIVQATSVTCNSYTGDTNLSNITFCTGVDGGGTCTSITGENDVVVYTGITPTTDTFYTIAMTLKANSTNPLWIWAQLDFTEPTQSIIVDSFQIQVTSPTQ